MENKWESSVTMTTLTIILRLFLWCSVFVFVPYLDLAARVYDYGQLKVYSQISMRHLALKSWDAITFITSNNLHQIIVNIPQLTSKSFFLAGIIGL